MKNFIKCTKCKTEYDFVTRDGCPNCKNETNLKETYKSLQRQDEYIFNQITK